MTCWRRADLAQLSIPTLAEQFAAVLETAMARRMHSLAKRPQRIRSIFQHPQFR